MDSQLPGTGKITVFPPKNFGSDRIRIHTCLKICLYFASVDPENMFADPVRICFHFEFLGPDRVPDSPLTLFHLNLLQKHCFLIFCFYREKNTVLAISYVFTWYKLKDGAEYYLPHAAF